MAAITARGYRELQRQVVLGGARMPAEHIRECLEAEEFRPDDFSIRRLAEATIVDRHGQPAGREFLEEIDPRRASGGLDLLEAGDAVNTSAFSNITGQLLFSKILEGYNMPGFLWPSLCQTISTQFDGEKIPGISGLGDEAETVREGNEYPNVGLVEEYIETPQTTKRGFIVPVTKEAIFFDRTNILLRNAGAVGESLGLNKEKRVVDVATGQTNNYKYKGTSYNTYYASGDSGPWTNKITDVLSDYTDIETAELLFDAMTDPVTGELITVLPDTLIVPTALKKTATNIMNTTEIRSDANQSANTRSLMFVAPNPLTSLYNLISGPMIKARTSSATAWFLGQPKKAFAYMENWGITTQQAANNSEADFTRDIAVRYKVSERGVAAVLDPRYMVYSTGGG